METLCFETPLTVYRYRALAIKQGFVELDEDGKLQIPKIKSEEYHYYDNDSLMQDPLVKEWTDDLKTKNNGKPKKTWRVDYLGLKRLCNTLKITPKELKASKEAYLKILQNLSIAIEEGKYQKDYHSQTVKDSGSAFYRMKMSSRLFVQFHGIPLPKNMGGIASGKTINHGQYADVRLTLEEIDRAEDFIIKKYGLDSDIFRVCFVGIESGARKTALLNMECSWTEGINKKGIKTFFMKAYESKTESSWTKYIRRPKTQESLLLQREKGEKFIISRTRDLRKKEDELQEQLRSVYKFLGKEESHNGYFMRKPFHALRHIATQYWIKISKGNLTLTRKACGWKSDVELIASYGDIPPEIVIEMLDDVDTV